MDENAAAPHSDATAPRIERLGRISSGALSASRASEAPTGSAPLLRPTAETGTEGCAVNRTNRFSTVVAASFALFGTQAIGQTLEPASVDSAGQIGDGFSDSPSMSSDGRFVVFHSWADNLVPGDTNLSADVFLHDRQTGTTLLVSLDSSGVQGNFGSFEPRVSADGRIVVFESLATNLVSRITSGARDVYVRDVFAGTTMLVTAGVAGGSGDGWSDRACISANGRFVAFASVATNLVPGDTNAVKDVFERDLATGTTARISVSANGGQALGGHSVQPSMSDDGRFVAFISNATNLVPGDVNGVGDVFVHDSLTGASECVSVGPNGEPANATSYVDDLGFTAISGDGRYVAFSSFASNLVAGDTNGHADVFVRDRVARTTERVSVDFGGVEGDGDSVQQAISNDGRFVTFGSYATNLVAGDTNGFVDVFFHDRVTGQTRRLSISPSGTEGNGLSNAPCMTASGDAIAFSTTATTLVPNASAQNRQVLVAPLLTLTLDAVAPRKGSTLGSDLVHLTTTSSQPLVDPVVRFGDASATIVATLPGRIDVRTPPGTGAVAVSVQVGASAGVLPSGFAYLDPELAARAGNANQGRGDSEDVLLVNAQAGTDDTRSVTLGIGQPISVVMTAPSSRTQSRFALYAWIGVPDARSLTALPRNLGFVVFPPPFAGGAPQPSVIWNNAGRPAGLGAATLPSQPAPSIVVSRASGFPHRANVALQGLVEDDASVTGLGWSVTNAVLLRVQ
jgi:Tol biopolymer transport system component